MPTSTFEPIATTALSGSSISFNSIPSTYRNLRLIYTGATNATSIPYVRFNNDTGANYSIQNNVMKGYGSNAGAYESYRKYNAVGIPLKLLSGSQVTTGSITAQLEILAYSNGQVTAMKNLLGRYGSVATATGLELGVVFGKWINTSAITSIQITLSTSTWSSGTATLWGY